MQTPYGLIKKPEPEKSKPIDSTPTDYTESYSADHGWFTHLFGKDGKVL